MGYFFSTYPVIIDKDIARSKWIMSRVKETFPGKDNLIRRGKIRTSSGLYSRPIAKLVLLCSKNEDLENSL